MTSTKTKFRARETYSLLKEPAEIDIEYKPDNEIPFEFDIVYRYTAKKEDKLNCCMSYDNATFTILPPYITSTWDEVIFQDFRIFYVDEEATGISIGKESKECFWLKCASSPTRNMIVARTSHNDDKSYTSLSLPQTFNSNEGLTCWISESVNTTKRMNFDDVLLSTALNAFWERLYHPFTNTEDVITDEVISDNGTIKQYMHEVVKKGNYQATIKVKDIAITCDWIKYK